MSKANIKKHNYTVEPFYQWDRNQVLEVHGLSLPSTPEVHFYNNTMERAIVRQATMDSAGVITVSVPNGLLQKPYTITAHLCIYNGATFETQYTLKLPVTPRTQPADYTIEDDDDVYSFNELSHKVDDAVAGMRAAEERFHSSVKDLSDSVGEGLIDSTLTQTGKAADAGAVGTAIDEISKDFSAALKSAASDTIANITKLLESVVLWEKDYSESSGPIDISIDLSAYRKISIVVGWDHNDNSLTKMSFFETIISVKNFEQTLFYGYDTGIPISNTFTVTDEGISWKSQNGRVRPVKIIGHKY